MNTLWTVSTRFFAFITRTLNLAFSSRRPWQSIPQPAPLMHVSYSWLSRTAVLKDVLNVSQYLSLNLPYPELLTRHDKNIANFSDIKNEQNNFKAIMESYQKSAQNPPDYSVISTSCAAYIGSSICRSSPPTCSRPALCRQITLWNEQNQSWTDWKNNSGEKKKKVGLFFSWIHSPIAFTMPHKRLWWNITSGMDGQVEWPTLPSLSQHCH